MQKVYTKIDWENYPSDKTPINETNLNKIDFAINEIDDRTIILENIKATKEEVEPLVKDIYFEEQSGIITIMKKNNSIKKIDTKMEKIAINFDYNENTQQIILTLIDGTKQYINLSALITQYEFLDTATIGFEITEEGKVRAKVLDGSITEDKLQPNYLADIKIEVAKAQASQAAASISATNAMISEKNTKNSELSAKTSEINASNSSIKAESYAVGETGTREDENIDNAKYYYEQAKNSATIASEKASETNSNTKLAISSATNAANAEKSALQSANNASMSEINAKNSAIKAESYACGGTNTREDENIDNAKYYYEQTKQLSQSLNGIIPMGTVTFTELPLYGMNYGFMYNISDDFISDSRFNDGGGIYYGAGNNVIWTAEEKWDVLAASSVTGIKGNNETSYRQGNVNLTAENIGLGNVDNTADKNKSVKYAESAGSATKDSNGNNITEEFKKREVKTYYNWTSMGLTIDSIKYLNDFPVHSIITLAIWNSDAAILYPKGIIPINNGGTLSVVTTGKAYALYISNENMWINISHNFTDYEGEQSFVGWRELPSKADFEKYLPLVGGTLTGSLNVGGKVSAWTDNEGGNLEIISPNDVKWQMDAFNDNFRIYRNKNNNIITPFALTVNGDAVLEKNLTVNGSINGYKINTNNNNEVWGKIPVINSNDGGLEVGNYLDFHKNNKEDDYFVRLICELSGENRYLSIQGGSLKGTLEGTASTAVQDSNGNNIAAQFTSTFTKLNLLDIEHRNPTISTIADFVDNINTGHMTGIGRVKDANNVLGGASGWKRYVALFQNMAGGNYSIDGQVLMMNGTHLYMSHIDGKTESDYKVNCVEFANSNDNFTTNGFLQPKGKLRVPSTGGSWVAAMDIYKAAIAITTQTSEDAYYPFISNKTKSGHIVSMGGMQDNFGFYGYKAGRTANGTDWSTVWDTSTGAITHSGKITASGGFVGNLNGTASSANSVAWGSITGKPYSYTPSSHTHNYLPLTGGTLTGNLNLTNLTLGGASYWLNLNGGTLRIWGDTVVTMVANTSDLNLIHTNASSYINLRCNSVVQCRNAANNAWIPISASSFANQSSKKYKKNITNMTEDEALKLLQYRVVDYDYINENDENGCQGLIAEEVAEINNYPVIFDKDGNPDGIDYSRFVPQLIKMVQLQQKEIEDLKQKFA